MTHLRFAALNATCVIPKKYSQMKLQVTDDALINLNRGPWQSDSPPLPARVDVFAARVVSCRPADFGFTPE